MKTVLITGATGALGRTVVNKLEHLGTYKIFTISRSENSQPTSIKCDLSDNQQLLQTLEFIKPDLILHLAANFSNDFAQAFTINVQVAKYILDYVKEHSYNTRVVLIGSAAEYGVLKDDENPVREDRMLAPVSTYGLSKAWQTQLITRYAQEVDVVCARIFNLFGDGVSDRLFAGRFSNQISEVLAGNRKVIEVGPLSAIRDYISTEDAAEQVLTIATAGKRGKVYHVASGVPISMRDFARQQLQLHGLDLEIIKESVQSSNHKGIDVPIIYADITQTKNLLKELI